MVTWRTASGGFEREKGIFQFSSKHKEALSTPLGRTEGKPQEDDLPEDGKGAEKLWQDGRSQEDQEKTHLPVQWRGTWEEPHREEDLHVNICIKKARKREKKTWRNEREPFPSMKQQMDQNSYHSYDPMVLKVDDLYFSFLFYYSLLH